MIYAIHNSQGNNIIVDENLTGLLGQQIDRQTLKIICSFFIPVGAEVYLGVFKKTYVQWKVNA